jgi:hypothetical protein
VRGSPPPENKGFRDWSKSQWPPMSKWGTGLGVDIRSVGFDRYSSRLSRYPSLVVRDLRHFSWNRLNRTCTGLRPEEFGLSVQELSAQSSATPDDSYNQATLPASCRSTRTNVKARAIIEARRCHYNTRRPDSALEYRSPASLTLGTYPAHLDRTSKMQ